MEPYRLVPWRASSHAPTEEELATRLEREGHSPFLQSDPPRFVHRERRHPYPTTWWVVAGWLRFQVRRDGELREVVVRDGDRLELEAETTYEVAVEGSGYATYFLVTPFALPPLSRMTGAGREVGPWPVAG